MRYKGFCMLFLAMALLLAAVPAAAVTNKIAWMASTDMSKWAIKIMNLDGSNQQNLSQVSDPSGQFSDRDPHFKPDGAKILFTSTRGGATERLYTMDPDGNNVAGLSPAGAAYSASTGKFSWDGARVVFKKVQSGQGNLAYFQVSDPAGTLTAIPNTGSGDLWPAYSPDGQWVVFQRDVGSQHMRIYKIHSDGSGLTPLTDGLHLDEMPYYSPDGQYIIFKRNSSTTAPPDIYRMNAADGTGIINLTNTPNRVEDAPIYSWDGKLIAYMGSTTGPFTAKIYTANPDGSGSQALTSDNNANFNPTFSPASVIPPKPGPKVSGKIAWMASADMSKWAIKIMNLDGSNQQNLSQVGDPGGQYSDRDPHFKPDGAKILFSSHRSGDVMDRLYTMDPDGNNVAGLSPAGAAYIASTGKFSWDGTMVVFKKSVPPGTGSLAYFQVSNPAVVTDIPNTSADDFWPAWSPDGQWVAFQRNVGEDLGHGKICRIKLDGSGLTELTDGTHPDEMPYYSPDGQYLIFKRGGGQVEPIMDVYRIKALDGSGLTNITNTPDINEDNPVYSWDGRFIACMADTTGVEHAQICLMKANGGNRQNLTNDNNANFSPSFSPLTVPGSGGAISLLLLDD